MINFFSDASMIVASLNLVNLIGNIFWTLKLRAIQGNKEIMCDLTEQNKAKDETIKSLKEERKQCKFQFQTLLSKYQKTIGELETYKNLNNSHLVL
jgi:hypothetical protein